PDVEDPAPSKEPAPALTGDDDDPVGTMVRPAEPPEKVGAVPATPRAARQPVTPEEPEEGTEPDESEGGASVASEADPVGTESPADATHAGDVQPVEELDERAVAGSDEPSEVSSGGVERHRSTTSAQGDSPDPGSEPAEPQ